MRIDNQLTAEGLVAGIVTADGIAPTREATPWLREELQVLIARRAQDGLEPEVQQAVRKLLRTPSYKPSGRGKPASEYLIGAAAKGQFPFINDWVDTNNLVSLLTGLPSSLLDAAPFEGELALRHGREGESYVFNSAGQEIGLEGLIVACRGRDGQALGNPVKDSLEGKIDETTTQVIVVMYAPESLGDALDQGLATFTRCFEGLDAANIQTQRC